jgi:hypothetical protein
MRCDCGPDEGDLDVAQRNPQIIPVPLLLPLYVRTLIFRLYLECAVQLCGQLTEEHKKKWLIFQLASKMLTGKRDLFLEHVHKLGRASYSFLVQGIHDEQGKTEDILGTTFSGTREFCVLDNAQNMGHMFHASSQPSPSPTTSQQALGEIVDLWSEYFGNFIASGTLVTLPPSDLTGGGMVAQEGPSPYIISDTGTFDTEDKVLAYLKRYIPLKSLSSQRGRHLTNRIAYWLRGRYAVLLPSNES